MNIDLNRVNLLEKDIEQHLYENPSSVCFSSIKDNGYRTLHTVTKWIGRQYEVPSGIIDLLGVTDTNKFVVVEVKLSALDGKAVAQVSRYARDIQVAINHIATGYTHDVEKLIIGSSIDEKTMFECLAMDVKSMIFQAALALNLTAPTWAKKTCDFYEEKMNSIISSRTLIDTVNQLENSIAKEYSEAYCMDESCNEKPEYDLDTSLNELLTDVEINYQDGLMTKRMIDSAIWKNRRFGELPEGAKLLLIGIVTTADDQGRVYADPRAIRAELFAFDDYTIKQMQEWLELLVNAHVIILYKNDDEQYAQLINWWSSQTLQFAQPSKFPKPTGWKDRIRYNFTKGTPLTNNWILNDGSVTEDTCDENGVPLPKKQNHPKPTPPSIQVDVQVDNDVAEHMDIQQEIQEEEEDKVVVVVNTPHASEMQLEQKATTTTTTNETVTNNKQGLCANFVTEYERAWGLCVSSPYQMEKILDWSDRVPLQSWTYALEQCADTRNIGKWNYFETILKRLEIDGKDGMDRGKNSGKNVNPTKTPSQESGKVNFSIEELFA